jgi:hypothetical protein
MTTTELCEIKALQSKGAKLSQLARADLAGLAGQAFVVFDGNELRACRDAAATIAAVVRAKRWTSSIDLTAIRAWNTIPECEPKSLLGKASP